MTREAAVKIILSHNRTFKKLVRRIEMWNENLTMVENAQKLGMNNNLETAHQFSYQYNLKFAGKHEKRRISYLGRRAKTEERYNSKWDENKSLKQNAESLGITPSSAYHAAARYKLSYIRVWGDISGYSYTPRQLNPKTIAWRKKAEFLSKQGFNHAQIADIVGKTRQAVGYFLK